MNWDLQYRSKVTDAGSALSHIHSGDRIYVGGGAGVPRVLMANLTNHASRLRDVEITHINLNDNTLEGFRHLTYPVFAVQYHPEASPGPHDARYLFDRFKDLMDKQ